LVETATSKSSAHRRAFLFSDEAAKGVEIGRRSDYVS
jgi:hypothetical protein